VKEEGWHFPPAAPFFWSPWTAPLLRWDKKEGMKTIKIANSIWEACFRSAPWEPLRPLWRPTTVSFEAGVYARQLLSWEVSGDRPEHVRLRPSDSQALNHRWCHRLLRVVWRKPDRKRSSPAAETRSAFLAKRTISVSSVGPARRGSTSLRLPRRYR